MWVALVVLIIMSLAGLAMMRQMGSGISVAGNIAFKQNATSTSDVGTEAARLWYTTQSSAYRDVDDPPNGYYATWSGTWGTTVDPTQFNWATGAGTAAVGAGAADTALGNTTQYIIQRLCRDPGPVSAATQVCSDLEDDQWRSKGSFDYQSPPLSPSFKPYFRVTTRVVGPRNTVSYTQVILN
jgi:type II secretory pathway pseudopilin PulG